MGNIHSDGRVREVLHHFQCNETEADIYMHCLQVGLASVQQIADKMGLNRFTVHSAIEQLVQKGFLYETRKGKRRMVGAESPDVLYQLLEAKQNDLDTLKVNIDYTTNLLRSMQPVHLHRPTVRFYDGTEGVKKLLEETLDATNEMLWVSNVDLLANICGEAYLLNYYKKRSKKGISTRLIFPENMEFVKNVHDHQKMFNVSYRVLPKKYNWKSGVCSWNKSIALLSYTEQHITCTVIENEDLAHFYRTVDFELSWQQAREVEL